MIWIQKLTIKLVVIKNVQTIFLKKFGIDKLILLKNSKKGEIF